MLMPRKTKYRKVQRGKRRGISKGCRTVAFGDYGLEAVVPVWLSAQQIEAIRVTMSRKLKKEGKFFLRVFPDKPVTKKPAETRMGKGKGSPEFWVANVKNGAILFVENGWRRIFGLQQLDFPDCPATGASRQTHAGRQSGINYQCEC